MHSHIVALDDAKHSMHRSRLNANLMVLEKLVTNLFAVLQRALPGHMREGCEHMDPPREVGRLSATSAK